MPDLSGTNSGSGNVGYRIALRNDGEIWATFGSASSSNISRSLPQSYVVDEWINITEYGKMEIMLNYLLMANLLILKKQSSLLIQIKESELEE